MSDPARRVKTSAYSYYIKEAAEDYKKEHPNEEIAFAEFSKKCAETWKKMSEIDKLKFSQIADEDTRRLNANPYIPPENVEDKVIDRDPNLPDLAHSAFFYFYEDERDKVKSQITCR
ncbi:hypothetical protein SUGI_1493160 [Cryptomeria japonica]|uniref:HMG box domain-containing protein n=1 Tax=Cryptomeria japonica TaxID=3369 RepID=A0AAD3NSI7_CRYJA|nr:hypothetical protein SUGI_1493160 [Cryptomeria japonica]